MLHTLSIVAGVIISLALGSRADAQSARAGGPAPTADASTRAAAELAATGNLSRGLVYRDLITTRAVIQAWDGPWGVYLQPYWMYSRIGTSMGRVTADNDVYVRVGAFRRITGATFAFAVNVYDHSLRRKVDHRDLFGGGAGVDLVQHKAALVLVSAGVLGEITAYGGERLLIGGQPGPATTGTRKLVRSAVRLHSRYRIGDGKLALAHDVIVLPSFRDPIDDYRVLITASIDAPIAKGFSARAQLDATRDAVIVEGTKHGALVITFGVSYRGEWQRERPEEPAR